MTEKQHTIDRKIKGTLLCTSIYVSAAFKVINNNDKPDAPLVTYHQKGKKAVFGSVHKILVLLTKILRSDLCLIS